MTVIFMSQEEQKQQYYHFSIYPVCLIGGRLSDSTVVKTHPQQRVNIPVSQIKALLECIVVRHYSTVYLLFFDSLHSIYGIMLSCGPLHVRTVLWKVPTRHMQRPDLPNGGTMANGGTGTLVQSLEVNDHA